MKLSKDIIDYIRNVVKIAKTVGIESVAFEKDMVRAMDENKTVVICHTDGVPDLPFDGIGIGRLDVFSSRFALVDGREGFATDAEISTKDNSQQVSQLIFKAKNIKVDYRCANTQTIKAPKAIKDPMTYEFTISADTVDILSKAQTAMSVDYVTIISNREKGMSFELVDTNNDVFSYEFSDQAVTITDRTDSEFVHRYPVKTVIALLKQGFNTPIQVGQRGFLRVIVNGINVTILPSI